MGGRTVIITNIIPYIVIYRMAGTPQNNTGQMPADSGKDVVVNMKRPGKGVTAVAGLRLQRKRRTDLVDNEVVVYLHDSVQDYTDWRPTRCLDVSQPTDCVAQR